MHELDADAVTRVRDMPGTRTRSMTVKLVIIMSLKGMVTTAGAYFGVSGFLDSSAGTDGGSAPMQTNPPALPGAGLASDGP